jgi:sugar phosphate isomerase/epimerase
MTANNNRRIDRRRFLQAGAATAAGLAGLPTLADAAKQPAQDPFGGFTVGVQSYSFRQFNLEQCLVQTQKLGLHYIELYRGHVPTDATPGQLKAVRNLCQQYQITPVGFGVENFSSSHTANRRLFEFGRALGVRYLSANPDPNSFDSLDKLVAEFDIAIAIHPHGPINNKQLDRWYNAETILAAVKNHHRLIGTCLDTGHLIRCAQPPFGVKLDPAEEIRRMGARNFALHLKDHDNKQRTDVVFGRGALNVLSVLQALREVKFTGSISIEYEANPKNPGPDIAACLEVFREAVRKLT